jgi:hypothetical protein
MTQTIFKSKALHPTKQTIVTFLSPFGVFVKGAY